MQNLHGKDRCLYGKRAAINHSYYSTETYQYKSMFNGTICYGTKHPTLRYQGPV